MPKDLFLIVEGPRDESVLRAIIEDRAANLGIRKVSLEFRRRPGAVCTKGVEIAAYERRNFDKVILIWDHADSPYANEMPQEAQGIVQDKLNKRTLKNCSKAIAVDPELEIWLCQDWDAIAKVLEVDLGQIKQWLEEWKADLQRRQVSERDLADLLRQRRVDLACDGIWALATKLPKEALEWLCRKARKKPDSGLWREIARQADLKRWENQCLSFRLLSRQLKRWFPQG